MDTQEITEFLNRARNGDSAASDVLIPLMYDSLRALARSYLAKLPANHTLDPTAVVHEAYLRLIGTGEIEWQDRAHFFAIAAGAMRNVLADHARKKKSLKRGGEWGRITISGLEDPGEDSQRIDLIALDEALAKLAQLDEQRARVVELRFLAGLDVKEAAFVMDVSTRTIERAWFGARAWLRRELAELEK